MPPVPGTVLEDGTQAWALMEPGTYVTNVAFRPRLTLSVEEGWFGIDADFALLLTRNDGYLSSFTLSRYAGTVTVDRCSTPELVEPRDAPNELIDWVLAYEGLDVT